QPPVPPQRPM
nr:Chain P, Lymphocyte cytosolic protein 2 [Homo sapiens]